MEAAALDPSLFPGAGVMASVVPMVGAEVEVAAPVILSILLLTSEGLVEWGSL